MISQPRSWIHDQPLAYGSLLHIGEEQVHAAVIEIRPEAMLICGIGREPRMDLGPAMTASTLAPVCEAALKQAEQATRHSLGQMIVPDKA